MRYAMTVEPQNRNADPNAAAVNSTVDADDKDAALERAEASYRRTYPNVGVLRMSVVRIRPRVH